MKKIGILFGRERSFPEALIARIGFEPTWRMAPVAMSGPPFEALAAVLPV